MARLKLFLAWLASHYAALAALFPLYKSKSWYFDRKGDALGYVISLRLDTARKLRFTLGGEWSPADEHGAISYHIELVIGPLSFFAGTNL